MEFGITPYLSRIERIILILALFVLISTFTARTVFAGLSRTEALQIVIDDVVGEEDEDIVDIWSDPVQISCGTEFKPVIGETVDSPSTGITWFFFVDYGPQANWAHPCRYVYVDIVTSVYTSYYRSCWYKATSTVDPIDAFLKLRLKEHGMIIIFLRMKNNLDPAVMIRTYGQFCLTADEMSIIIT